MKLTLLKPFEKIELDIEWLEVESSAGNFVITPGHAPMILALKQNSPLVYQHSNGTQERLLVKSGMLEVSRTALKGILFQ